MTAQAIYEQFLAAPNSSFLSESAILSYVTTTTMFHGPTEIIKHYGTLRNQVKKKSEHIIDVIEVQNALWIEIATTLEFITSGGIYLPGLDDNFLADREVVILIDHVVRFDSHGKIKSIRQNWDQGALLKQVDVIGRSGRNWPIREAKDQIKLISTLDTSSAKDAKARNQIASNNAMRDPHASLSLFASREELETSPTSIVTPKAGTRPRQRSLTEILGDKTDNGIPNGRNHSPSKAGAGKNFAPNRLFEAQQEEPEEPETPPRSKRDSYLKPNPKKYHHFDFADGSDPQDTPKPGVPLDKRPKSKHDSSWDFEDFITPQKVLPTRGISRRQDRVHWSTVEDEAQETPVSKPAPPKPRHDNDTHFQIEDDGGSHDKCRLIARRGEAHNIGLGLYKNDLFDESEENGGLTALGNITNLKDRRKDFDSQFNVTDNSPHASSKIQHITEDRKKAVRMMESSWDAYDESPRQKENLPLGYRGNGNNTKNLAPEEGGRVYQVAGDGMGSRKGARGWSIGDSDEESTPQPVKRQTQRAKSSFDWDF